MSKNIIIPLQIFLKTLNLLEYLDVSDYAPPLRLDYDEVISALQRKKQTIELRNSYAHIIYADNEVQRHDARMLYLLQKHELNDF